MDRKGHRKNIIALCVLFICTGLISFTGFSGVELHSKEYKLADFPNNLNGWVGIDDPVSSKVINSLELDDLLSRTYSKGDSDVSVYVGYYYDPKKVGKLHSPLVCFPGQGWNIYDDNSSKLQVGPLGEFRLNVRTMIAERRSTKQLVLFWYQAYDKALNSTFVQKLTVVYNKITRHKGESAFMRVIVRINSNGVDKARSTAEVFLNDFYPEFIKYVKS